LVCCSNWKSGFVSQTLALAVDLGAEQRQLNGRVRAIALQFSSRSRATLARPRQAQAAVSWRSEGSRRQCRQTRNLETVKPRPSANGYGRLPGGSLPAPACRCNRARQHTCVAEFLSALFPARPGPHGPTSVLHSAPWTRAPPCPRRTLPVDAKESFPLT
jgi:hypothetical protein